MPISASRNLLQRGLGTRITTEIVAPHRLLVNCSRDGDIAEIGLAEGTKEAYFETLILSCRVYALLQWKDRNSKRYLSLPVLEEWI